MAASAAGFGLCLSGLPFYTTGVFVAPLSQAFGWSVATIQGGLTLLLLSNVISLPVASVLVERFGARPVALGSVILFALSFMSFGLLNGDLTAFYLHWILLSATGAGTLAVTWTRAISAVFTARRGLALGVAMMGTGLTAFIAPVLANALIAQASWRWAYVALGAAPLIIAAPMVWLMFWDHTPKAAQETRPAGGSPRLWSSRRFWLIGLSFLLIGSAVAGTLPNLIRLLVVHGFSPSRAAGLASLLGLFVILGRLSGGYLLDRIWAPATAAGFFLLAATACLVLQLHAASPLLVGMAAAALGMTAGVELDMLPYLATRYFASARLSTNLGVLSTFFYAGSALGPWGFARIGEMSGGYSLPLFFGAGMFAMGAGGLLLLGPYPDAAPQA